MNEKVSGSVYWRRGVGRETPRKQKLEKEISVMSHSFLLDNYAIYVKLWLTSPVSQLFLLRNRCTKSQLGLPASFKGDLSKLSMKFQNVTTLASPAKQNKTNMWHGKRR